MSLRLPTNAADSYDIVWRELLRFDFDDREYEAGLRAVVQCQTAGFLGAIIAAVNGMAAMIGVWFMILVPFLAARLGNGIILWLNPADTQAQDFVARFYNTLQTGSAWTVFSCVMAMVVAGLVGAQATWPDVFQRQYVGFLAAFHSPICMAYIFPLVFFFSGILTAVCVMLLNKNQVFSEPIVFRDAWHWVYWIGAWGSVAVSVAFTVSYRDELSSNWLTNARHLAVWWSGRPHYLQLEKALTLVGTSEFISLANSVALTNPNNVRSDQVARNLTAQTWQERFVARHTLVRLGGLAVDALVRHKQASLAKSLMRQIRAETTRLLAHRRYLCERCWATVYQHSVVISGERFTYYGCRMCKQGHSLRGLDRKLVGVLDTRSTPATMAEGPDFVWNFNQLKQVADLDRFEVRHACDEDVERFLIEISEIMDDGRRGQCKAARFVIHSPGISENTVRMAQQFFQRVEV